jgi:hypothetical protein
MLGSSAGTDAEDFARVDGGDDGTRETARHYRDRSDAINGSSHARNPTASAT